MILPRFGRDRQIKQQNKVQWLYPLVLFLIIITLFPLAMGTEPKLLHQLSVPAVGLQRCCHLLWGWIIYFVLPRQWHRNKISGGKRRRPGADWLMVHWLTSAGMVCLLSFLAVPLFGLTAKEAWAAWWLYFGGQSAIIMLIGYHLATDVVAKKWRGLGAV